MGILDWSIPDAIKLKLLKFDKEPISVVNKNYSTDVQEHILRHNLLQDDLVYLYSSYDRHSSRIKAIITGYAVNEVDQIISSISSIPQTLKLCLMEHPDITTDKKVELIIAMIPDISLSDAC